MRPLAFRNLALGSATTMPAQLRQRPRKISRRAGGSREELQASLADRECRRADRGKKSPPHSVARPATAAVGMRDCGVGTAAQTCGGGGQASLLPGWERKCGESRCDHVPPAQSRCAGVLVAVHRRPPSSCILPQVALRLNLAAYAVRQAARSINPGANRLPCTSNRPGAPAYSPAARSHLAALGFISFAVGVTSAPTRFN